MATGRIGTTPVLQVRWSKAPSDGTTSLSGLDDNSVSLVYSVGYEAVYRNGVLLSRTNDYTATDGTTVTLIDATITGDIIEIFANQTIPLSDTYSQTVSDGKFINNTLTTTTGDIIYASGANTPARLAIGTSADVLTVSGGIPAWAAPAGGGKLLQVVSATTTTSTAITSTVYTDTTITATITPTLATSKIFIMISASLRSFRQSDGTFADAKLLRNAVELDNWTDRYFMGMDVDTSATENNLALVGQPSITYMDSPVSTSALTYKLQGAVYNASASSSATFQINSTRSTITLFEIGV
jgi:hypothetical protein